MKPWKARKFFGDVVYDLRSRGLLPVVILLLVAMVAVPVLISRGNKGSSAASLQPTAGTAQISPEAQQAVLAYNPGIRDYKKRLDDLSAKDPFRQQFAQSAAAASQLNSTVTTTTSGGGTGAKTSTTSTTATIGGSGGPGHKKKKKKHSKTVTTTYQVNILAGDIDSQLTPFNNVQQLTTLPGQDKPVVVFYGLSADHQSALFLVSNRVGTLTGPGSCIPAPDDCSMLTLGAGQSEDLFYSTDGKTYRVVVAEIKRFTK
jgi:uncharacterized protein (UPF0333 family)